jgi:hypothetical protein
LTRSQLAVALLALIGAGTAGVAAGGAGVDDRPARDRRPPQLDISVEPDVLANPNGRLRPVRISGEVADEEELEDVYLAVVESSDPGAADDIAGAQVGSFDDELLLRAERTDGGRRYRITFIAVDSDGNEARASATVSVAEH